MAVKPTPQQQMAIDDRGGKLLVSAAAGSGKTKVLVDRVLKYVLDPIAPANIDEFLIITYTRAAAAELRAKIASKLSEHIAQQPENQHLQRQVQRLYLTKISTVHSFCGDILRESAYRMDIPADFRIADTKECDQIRQKAMDMMMEQAYLEIGEDPDLQAFVDTQGLGRNDRLVQEIVAKVFDSAMRNLDPVRWLKDSAADQELGKCIEPTDTKWGRYLFEDLQAYLCDQIEAMGRCAQISLETPGFEKVYDLLQANIQVLQTLQQCSTWSDVHQHRTFDFKRFPAKTGNPDLANQIKLVREYCKTGLEKKLSRFADSTEQVIDGLLQTAASSRGVMNLVARFTEIYNKLKKQRRVLDYADLEHQAVELLLGKDRVAPTAVAKEIAQRYREIMVDEYQDSNAVQDAIFTALSYQKQNVFMVGDVKQSIYGFRLADPTIFLEKYASYVPAEVAEPGQGRKIMLSSNFRSCRAVIDAVNDVFRECMSEKVGGLEYGEAEMLYEGVPHIPLDEPEVELHAIEVCEAQYPEEAAFVAQRISELLDGTHHVRDGESLRPIQADDIAILLRSPSTTLSYFRKALAARGIRCVTDRGNNLLKTSEVIALRSMLQVISNPRQDIPLTALLLSPVFGFDANTLAAVRAKRPYGCIYDAVRTSDTEICVSFVGILEQLREKAAVSSLPALLEEIFRTTHIDTIFAAMPDGDVCEANLRLFTRVINDYALCGIRHLDQLLEQLELLDKEGMIVPVPSSGGAVTITSIHKSKGLEYPVVFLCNLSKQFSNQSFQEQVFHDSDLGLGLSCLDTKHRIRYPSLSKHAIGVKMKADLLSEEMRILYVAMTRARDRLIMTYASKNIAKDLSRISLRMDLCSKALLTTSVHGIGGWVLYAALKRTEAGAFFALCDRPKETVLHTHPWKITVQSVPIQAELADVQVESTVPAVPRSILERMANTLTFRYPWSIATKTPSKQTPTQLKGRIKDNEAAENAAVAMKQRFHWRSPAFAKKERSAAVRGSATHAVMQYIRYDQCSDASAVAREVQRMVRDAYLTEEQSQLVDCEQIARFFATDIGEKLRKGNQVIREFKFSVLADASVIDDALTEEKILLQGVVDCALIETDGITVIDFKTDKVTDETRAELVSRYAVQVNLYAQALCRIFELPIKGKALYFFCLNEFSWL